MIIDAHVHVWADHSQQYPHNRLTPPPAYPVETLLAQMDIAGVTHAILVQPSLYGSNNNYLADCVRLYPNRLAGMGMIDVRAEDIASQFFYWVEKQGLRGFRLMPMSNGQDDLLSLPGMEILWQLAGEYKLPLSLFVAPRHIPQLSKLVKRYPDTFLIIEHFGRPDDGGQDLITAVQAVLDLAVQPSVFIKVSAISYISSNEYPYSDTYPMIKAVWEHFGSQRLMWGSDFPGVIGRSGYIQELALVGQHLPFLQPQDKDWLLYKSAQLFWPFDAGDRFSERQ